MQVGEKKRCDSGRVGGYMNRAGMTFKRGYESLGRYVSEKEGGYIV